MHKRLSLTVVLSALALVFAGCDDEDPGPDAGPICGGDSGVICEPDAGEPDGGPSMDEMCQTTGSAGGRCRARSCAAGLRCFEELTGGGAITLDLLGIPTAVEDPENPGRFLTEDDLPEGDFAPVPIGFGPGGQCSQACDPANDMCPSCSTCTTALGPTSAFGAVGLDVGFFDQAELTSDARPGICRAQCDFDPNERGCQEGYSCSASDNLCLEECVSDSQCNLGWALTRRDYLVAVVDGTATCNADTGRCEWTAPAGATVGSECEATTDCPADVGECLIGGICTTFMCNENAGGVTTPCPEGSICGLDSETDGGSCFKLCDSAADCGIPGVGCTAAFFGADNKVCLGICTDDNECGSAEACRIGGLTNPNLGTCQPTCEVGGTDCGDNERCVQAEGEDYGFCASEEMFCFNDGECLEGQACEVLGADFLGQCIAGCTEDADCDTGEQCRIQAGGESCDEDAECPSGVCTDGTCEPSTLGVCRAPDGECAQREDRLSNLLALRGDAQCLPTQQCVGAANAIVTCTDRPATGGCSSDDCPGDQECLDEAGAACTTGDDCMCREPEEAEAECSDGDCPGDQECLDEAGAACTTGDDCMCREPAAAPECTMDDECPDDEECVDRSCVASAPGTGD